MNNEAISAILGGGIGIILSGGINYLLQRLQFKHNKEMFLLQNLSREEVKEILRDLLNHKTHTDRSFSTIKKRVGGYADDEIRKLLHEIGAKKTISNDNEEWWYLKERTEERNRKRNEP